jgi:hypothetical protein
MAKKVQSDLQALQDELQQAKDGANDASTCKRQQRPTEQGLVMMILSWHN